MYISIKDIDDLNTCIYQSQQPFAIQCKSKSTRKTLNLIAMNEDNNNKDTYIYQMIVVILMHVSDNI